MIKLGFYRILTLVLLPFAALFGFLALMMLFVALANPPMLLPVFVVACVAIYVFASFNFLNKGILQGRQCKTSLKDWIRVNSYVSIVFSVMVLLNFAASISNPDLLSQAVDQAMPMQGDQARFSKQELVAATRLLMFIIGTFAALLLIHIIISFRLLKQFAHRFGDSSQEDDAA